MTIKEITAAATRPLRLAILRPNQTLAECVYPDDDHDDSFHLGAYDGEDLLCVASLYRHREELFNEFDEPFQYRLRGMATRADRQGQGFGKALLKEAIDKCWANGAEIFWCNARLSAAVYYEKMGFSPLPTEFDIPGIGAHRVMYLRK